jgi:hypothetical protein
MMGLLEPEDKKKGNKISLDYTTVEGGAKLNIRKTMRRRPANRHRGNFPMALSINRFKRGLGYDRRGK